MQAVFNVKKFYVLVFFLFFKSIVFCFSQLSVYKGRGAVAEISMPSPARSVSHFDLFLESSPSLAELENNYYWYKVVFKKTCDFELELFPLVESDHYMYRVFKVKNNRPVCEAKADQAIFPINDIRKDVIYTDHYQSESFRANLIFTTKVQVDPDDAIYIVIEPQWGNDQGHILGIKTCDSSFVFKTIKSRSASDSIARIKTISDQLGDEFALAAVCKKFCPAVEPFPDQDKTLVASIALTPDHPRETTELLPAVLTAGDRFILNNILFHPNTAVVKSESVKELDRLTDFMRSNPSAVISIEGHTNTDHFIFKDEERQRMGKKWAFQGSAKQLSLDRASEVKAYLVKKGIEPSRIQCVGWGGTRKLVNRPKTTEEMYRNMRVEVVILKS